MKAIDKLDRLILLELDKNCRVTVSSLARQLKQARERIEYRLARFNDLGIIRGFHAIVNPYRLGKIVYVVSLNIRNAHPLLDALDKELEAMPSTYWIGKCSGRWDRMFDIFAPSPLHFYETLNKLLSRFHELVIDYEVSALVNVWHGYRHWLLEKGAPGHFFLGGAIQHFPIDELDNSILLELIKNARASVAEIGERLNAAPTTVTNRIDRLVQAGIIAGFRAALDLNKLQMLSMRAHVRLTSVDKAESEKMREYCIIHPNIIGYVEQIASAPVELEVEAPFYRDYLAIMNEFSDRFSKNIHSVDTYIMSQSGPSVTCNFL